jgi:hypothetical protein
MNDTEEIVILKTKPSLKTIGFGLFGTMFFGAFVYLMLTLKWTVGEGTNYKTGMVIMYILLGIFLFFTFGCLWLVLSIKTVILTNKNLKIQLPFLQVRKIFPVINIKDIKESPFKISPMIHLTSSYVYAGKQIKIDFNKGNSIKLNSFEIPNYYSLTMHLNTTLKKNKQNELIDREELAQNKYDGYGWLVLVILLTFGLVVAIIKQRL